MHAGKLHWYHAGGEKKWEKGIISKTKTRIKYILLMYTFIWFFIYALLFSSFGETN